MAKVLVVDDESAYRELMREMLSGIGHEVQTAETASSAVEIGSQFRPDLLVVDWMLRSDLDGFDVANSLRKVRPDLRTILITGFPTPSLEAKAVGARIGAVLYKPFDAEELLDAVRRATDEPLEN